MAPSMFCRGQGGKTLFPQTTLDILLLTGWRKLPQFIEKLPLYKAARVVVVPSRWPEPFGMVGLEAMSHGRPVVGFNVGGISDWLEDARTGILVPEQDTTAFAQALEQIIGDQELANLMGRNAYKRLCQGFAFDKYMDRMEEFLCGQETVR